MKTYRKFNSTTLSDVIWGFLFQCKMFEKPFFRKSLEVFVIVNFTTYYFPILALQRIAWKIYEWNNILNIHKP